MAILWIILGILFILISVVVVTLYAKTRIIIHYRNGKLRVKYKNLLLRYLYQKDDADEKEKPKDKVTKESVEEELKEATSLINDTTAYLWKVLREMRFRIEIVKPCIKIEYGTDDPVDTGVLYGVIWTVIGTAYQLFNQYLTLDFPDTDIRPNFEKEVFRLQFDCIIKVRLVHIISALLNIEMKKLDKEN